MTRRPDWIARLSAYVEDVRARPFLLGTMDCGLFAAGAVEAMTGEDPAAHLRGRYDTLDGVMRLLSAKGFAGPVDYALALFPRIPKAMAQVGDLAAVETDEGPALGVVQGSRIYLVGAAGLTTLDLLDRRVRLAFRV